MERSDLQKAKADNAQLRKLSRAGDPTSNPPSPWTGSAVASAQLRKDSRASDSTAKRSAQDILTILHKWGIHTLGQFTALDREQLGARLGPEAVRMWERAN